MKKIITLLTCLTVLCGLAIAETVSDDPFEREKFEAEKTSTYVIIPEDQHCTDKNASVRIEYSPIYDEVRIYYETLYVTYDRGEAMNTVLACLQDFQKENKYIRYRYLRTESQKLFKDDRGQKKMQWSAYLKFDR
ncbi:MAG: hypothetical protein K6C97_06190 [Treponema sp.]|nr:hypothetical protein [Treponema sp.]